MSFTTTTNYGLKKVDVGTELNVWGPIPNENWDTVSTQMKLNADAAAAASALATGKAPLVHVHAGADITTGTLAAARLPAFTGDVTSAVGTAVNVIAAASITNAKLANMAANTIKGTIAGGVPTDLTAANVLTITGLTDVATKEVQNPQSGSYTLVVGDAGKMVTFSGAATVSINTGIFAAGHRIDILQLGSGAVTFGGTCTRRIFPSTATKLAGQYAGATVWFTNVANECVIIGNVIA